MLYEIVGEFSIGIRALVLSSGEDRRTRRGRLGELDGAWDRRRQNGQGVAVADVGEHVATVRGSSVVQSRKCAEQNKIRVGDGLDFTNRTQQLSDAAVCEGFALQWNQNRLRRSQSVEREHTQRRWAVDDDDVVRAQERRQRPLERELSTGSHQEQRFGAREIDRGRQEIHTVVRLQHGVDRVEITRQDLVDRTLEAIRVVSERERQAALRVEIHHQNSLSERGQSRTERSDGSGFSHAALLIRHCENRRHT